MSYPPLEEEQRGQGIRPLAPHSEHGGAAAPLPSPRGIRTPKISLPPVTPVPPHLEQGIALRSPHLAHMRRDLRITLVQEINRQINEGDRAIQI